MKSWLIGVMLLGAMALAGWWLLGPRPVSSELASANAGTATQTPSAGPAGAAKSMVSPAPSGPTARSALTIAVSALHREFSQAKDYFALYKSLEGRTDAEALFYKASILDRCRRWSGNQKKETPEEHIVRFNGSITGPYRDIRMAINAKLVANAPISRCVNFSTPISEADVDAAYDAAAKAGDIRGQVDRLHRSLVAGGDVSKVPTLGMPFAPNAMMERVMPAGPTEAEVALLKQALASKDPVLIEAAGPLLSAQYSHFELKFGDGNGLVGIPDYFLWKSVACHYAGGCGSDSFFVQQNCALHGRCDVSTLDEQMQRYIFNEANWRNFELYRATLINAIDTQDWSLLQERRGPRTNTWGNQIMTGNRSPRFNLRFY